MDKLTEKEKQALNELVEGLKKLYGDNLSRVVLYGSKARGDATEESDIDILIVLKDYEEWNKEFERISDIIYAIEEKNDFDLFISFVLKKQNEYLQEKSPLLLNVKREGVEL